MGDSLTPMRLSVYEVTKSLKGLNNYTHIDPEAFADMSAPLGTSLFTGKTPPTTRRPTPRGTTRITTRYTTSTYSYRNRSEKTSSRNTRKRAWQAGRRGYFSGILPGLYFTTSFGNSTILSVNLTSLDVHYHYTDKGDRPRVQTPSEPPSFV